MGGSGGGGDLWIIGGGEPERVRGRVREEGNVRFRGEERGDNALDLRCPRFDAGGGLGELSFSMPGKSIVLCLSVAAENNYISIGYTGTNQMSLPRFEPPPNSSNRRSNVTFSWRTRGSADFEDLSDKTFFGVGDLEVRGDVASSLISLSLKESFEGILRGEGRGCGSRSGVTERGGGELDLMDLIVDRGGGKK